MAKIAYVEATLPELKGGNSRQTGHGEGANAKAAISRAFGDILKKVKGKRISIIESRVILTNKSESSEAQIEAEEQHEASKYAEESDAISQ